MSADLLVPVQRRAALLDRPLAGHRTPEGSSGSLLAAAGGVGGADRLARREAVLHLLEISRQRRRQRVG